MALAITKADAERLAKRAVGLQQRAKSTLAKAEGIIETVVRTTEVGASAFAFGVIQGRWGGMEIVGVPLDLGFGVSAHLAAFVMDSNISPHLHALADGAMAAFAVTMGFNAGEGWYEKTLSPDQRKLLETKRKELADAKRSAGIRGLGLSDAQVNQYAGR